MKPYPIHIAALMGALLFTGCESEAPEVDFNVTADKTEAAVGEPVTFSISHNDMLLTVYNGEQGHNYDLSADFILAGKTEQDLQDNNYRPADPEVRPYKCDLADTEAGSTTVKLSLIHI